jgi:hypothetical protein
VPVPRRFDRRPPERDTTRVNERIRVPEVRVIGEDGKQIGVMRTDDALRSLAVVEQRPTQDGRNMTMMLGPSKAVLAGTLEEEGGAGNGSGPGSARPAAPPQAAADASGNGAATDAEPAGPA